MTTRRKAGKRRIADFSRQFEAFLVTKRIEARIAAIECPQGRANVAEWLADARDRITTGDFTLAPSCFQALVRSIVRALENFEDGYYLSGTATGGFNCRTYQG